MSFDVLVNLSLLKLSPKLYQKQCFAAKQLLPADKLIFIKPKPISGINIILSLSR